MRKVIQEAVRNQINTGKLEADDPVGKAILAAPDARTLTVEMLKLKQTGQELKWR
jgi:hypothetical protein